MLREIIVALWVTHRTRPPFQVRQDSLPASWSSRSCSFLHEVDEYSNEYFIYSLGGIL